MKGKQMNYGGAALARLKPIDGFPKVADKIASDPDKTTTIYRRFDRLSARNLLLLQSELAQLEALQNRYDTEDLEKRDQITIDCHRDWECFEKHGTTTEYNGQLIPPDPNQKEKMELSMKIRAKLKEYHEHLTLHQTLLNSKPPAATTVKALRNWFFDNTANRPGQDGIPQLWGSSETIYDDVYDLVALRVPADQDRLSDFIIHNFGVFFQTTSPDGQSTNISERSIARCVAILSSILSAILLFGSIVSLYFVHNPYVLLGMLGGWTVLFAACVGLLTSARRDQVFGATAAYAAVLVVFVSGTLGGAPGNYVMVGNCTGARG